MMPAREPLTFECMRRRELWLPQKGHKKIEICARVRACARGDKREGEGGQRREWVEGKDREAVEKGERKKRGVGGGRGSSYRFTLVLTSLQGL